MKNKKLILALAVGVAAAGAIAYFLTTGEGKKARQRMQKKTGEMTAELDSILQDAKQKFFSLKESLTEGCRREEEIPS